ncbi:MAG: type II secretion system major pseudopilin GspG [Planctomycetota bacterium]|nr:type II secretion system major pseudopilin GspG [Planctomycetota bacterium]
MYSDTTNRRRVGFSLVEIMVVIVIIGLLAGMVTINVRGYMLQAKQNTARAEMATIVQALSTFYTAYGRYPTNEEGLACLTRGTEKIPEPLLTRPPADPWGRSYQYNCPGSNGPFELICYGADAREGGTGADADISSDDLKSK